MQYIVVVAILLVSICHAQIRGNIPVSDNKSGENYAVVSSRKLYEKFSTPFNSKCRSYPFYDQFQRIIENYASYKKFLVYNLDSSETAFGEGMFGVINAFLLAIREDRLLVIKSKGENKLLDYVKPYHKSMEVGVNHTDIYHYYKQQSEAKTLKTKTVNCDSESCLDKSYQEYDVVELTSNKALVCSWMNNNATKATFKKVLFNDMLLIDDRTSMTAKTIDENYLGRDMGSLDIAGCALRMVFWPTTTFFLSVARNYNKQIKASIAATDKLAQNTATNDQSNIHMHQIASHRHFTLINNTLLPDFKHRTSVWMKHQRDHDFLQTNNPSYHKIVQENLINSPFLSSQALYLPRRIFFQLSVHYQCTGNEMKLVAGNTAVESATPSLPSPPTKTKSDKKRKRNGVIDLNNGGNRMLLDESTCKVPTEKHAAALNVGGSTDNPVSLATCANEILTKFIDTNYYPSNTLSGRLEHSKVTVGNYTRAPRPHNKVFHNLHRRKASLPMLLHLSSDSTASVEQMHTINEKFPFTLASTNLPVCKGVCIENELIEFMTLVMSDVILMNDSPHNSYALLARAFSLKKDNLYNTKNCGTVIDDHALATTTTKYWSC